MSSQALPFIYAAVIGLAAFNLVRGFRSNVMHFGLNAVGADADRRNDPRGFLIYATCNALAAAMCVYLLIYPR